MTEVKLIFEKSSPGKLGWELPPTGVPDGFGDLQYPQMLRKQDLNFPEVSELDVVRHYINLSSKNHGVDSGFYPLGSCTMKYNPKINEDLSRLPGFQNLHPLSPETLSQGSLSVYDQLEKSLREITGMDCFSLQPAAGAQGELAAMFMIKEYFHARGEIHRNQVLIPTSAHGTNPASAAMAGFQTIPVDCDPSGLIDLDQLKKLLNHDIAALMLTNPNTLGLFEREITQIAPLVHENGGLLYYDGANLNAIMGLTRPGDMGFDLIHLNLHKTFATPHGGGGPGAGPVGVKAFLSDFLPVPILSQNEYGFFWDYNRPRSIGKILGFYGNFEVLLKALIYITAMGGPGLEQVSRDAILNANYIRARLKSFYTIPYDRPCMHEFVLTTAGCRVKALDIAKRLLDYDFHPPTIYFPLIVEEAMMIEPTETEGKDTLDQFIETLTRICRETTESPHVFSTAPHHTSVGRVNEVKAAKTPKLRWDRVK